jgi:hypothetical protein
MITALNGVIASGLASIPLPPSNTLTPVISGTNVVGNTLTTTNGTWSGTLPITYTYQWKRNGSNIVGATASTYLLVQADATFDITCSVTGTNILGNSTATSNALTIFDANAQLFIDAETAAGEILSTTQKNAVNQWVVDSKSAAIWTKMKAVYPIVGGTATAHKFNLINPADTNAAFRLVFSGGWTHSATGMLPNGTNAFSNTFFAPSVNSTSINSFHNSYYSRTNVNLTQVDSGCGSSDLQGTLLEIRTANLTYVRINAASTTNFSDTDSLGFYSQSRLSGTQQKGYKNNILKVTGTVNSNTAPSQNFYIGAYNNSNTPFYYSSKECAFASIGDGLTDLESQILYQITEKFQVALGRNINATQSFYYNSAYNNETNAFLFSTQITDNTIQTATNTLVTDLKTAGVYTKMRAIYPMVGGTATTNQYNLINPQNSNAANRLSFNGAWTHSSNGALPSGSGGSHADTYISGLAQNSTHLLYYSRTNSSTDSVDMGVTGTNSIANRLSIRKQGAGSALINSPSTDPTTITVADSRGCFMANRTASNVLKFIKNGITLTTYTTASTGVPATFTLLLAATTNSSGSVIFSSNKECAFASAGDGLTDLESQVFYQIIEKFQVALGRSINPTQSFYYNTAYNNETNAFLFSTQITDATIQTATNTLVTDLKTAGVYTKMKALYPMVGGTATTHKFNLVNTQDTNEAFRLAFVGGWTHSSNGALPNGTNAYANTFLIPTSILTQNDCHISHYSRTANSGLTCDIGSQTPSGNPSLSLFRDVNYNMYRISDFNFSTVSTTTSKNFQLGSRISASVKKMVLNNTTTDISTTSVGLGNQQTYISAILYNGLIQFYSARECAFASIGNGLTDAESLAFYNAVQLFQTTLGRQV